MTEAQELSPVDDNTQQPVAVPQEVLAEVERLRAHVADMSAENARFREQRRMAEDRAVAAEKQLKTERQRLGSSPTLDPDTQARLDRFDELQKRVSELEAERDQSRKTAREEKIKSAAVAAFSERGAINAANLYRRWKDDLVLRDDGSVAAFDGGIERSLDQFVEDLRAPGSPNAYEFQPSGARGTGAVGSQPMATQGIPNPYAAGTRNFAAAVALESGTPEEQALAARFKAEAGVK